MTRNELRGRSLRRRVFVFGGTSGINLGIAKSFAASGAIVAVASRNPSKVDAAVGALNELGAEALGFALDVREPEAVADAAASFADRFGAIDVVVSGAAGNFPIAASKLSPNGFKSVVDIDLIGTFHVMRAPIRISRGRACIINISAPQAFIPMELQVHVCAAKAGVDMITRTLAMEWGPEGIRVNSIIPGPIAGTEGMARLASTAEAASEVIDCVPLRRLGRRRTSRTFVCSSLPTPLASCPAQSSQWTAAGSAAGARQRSERELIRTRRRHESERRA